MKCIQWSIHTVECTHSGIYGMYTWWIVYVVRHTHDKTYTWIGHTQGEGYGGGRGVREDIHTEGYIHGVDILTEETYTRRVIQTEGIYTEKNKHTEGHTYRKDVNKEGIDT